MDSSLQWQVNRQCHVVCDCPPASHLHGKKSSEATREWRGVYVDRTITLSCVKNHASRSRSRNLVLKDILDDMRLPALFTRMKVSLLPVTSPTPWSNSFVGPDYKLKRSDNRTCLRYLEERRRDDILTFLVTMIRRKVSDASIPHWSGLHTVKRVIWQVAACRSASWRRQIALVKYLRCSGADKSDRKDWTLTPT